MLALKVRWVVLQMNLRFWGWFLQIEPKQFKICLTKLKCQTGRFMIDAKVEMFYSRPNRTSLRRVTRRSIAMHWKPIGSRSISILKCQTKELYEISISRWFVCESQWMAQFVIQEGLPFNHFDNKHLTKLIQETLHPCYTHVSREL